MDSIFNVGGAELLVILLLAGIVMGPKRIQVVAHWLGRMTAQLQIISRGFARQLNAELTAVDEGGELKGSFDEIQELRRQLDDLKKEITSVAKPPMNQVKSTINETRETVNHRIMPPNFEVDTEKTGNSNKTNIPPSSPPPALPSIIDITDDPD